jgi:mRNA interferase HicA
VTSEEFKRWLRKQGCTFTTSRGKGSHILVHYGDRTATLPMHGSDRELGKGLVERIKKQLGLS